ncbi:MAG: ABC transporter substrate-binding protein [Dehalococcoidia bacterium]|nr:ABC transporter substrate-binding protein [Dehalococcoidia bacterium]
MIRLLAATVVGTLLLVGCGSEKSSPGPRPSPTPTIAASVTVERTVKDIIGRDVAVPATVNRVVALSPSAVDFAAALGLELAGRPSDAPNAPGSVPQVGSSIMPDFAAVAAATPDLVLADASFHGARLRDFEQFPYPVFVLKTNSYQDILQSLTALGQVSGRDEQARTTIADIEARVAAAKARGGGNAPPSVLILTGGGREVYAGSDATYLGDLVRLLGATNVLGSSPQGAPIAGFGLVEITQVATLDPGVVLVISSGDGGLVDTIRSSPEWALSAAVTNDRVYELDTLLYLRSPGPAVAEAVEQLAGMLFAGS